MPDVVSFPQRRSSVSMPASQATATTLLGAPTARRLSGLLSSVLDWLQDVVGFGEVTVDTGAYLCPTCLSVYDDYDEHLCIYTAQCLECNRRTILDAGKCSICESRSFVLARRGV